MSQTKNTQVEIWYGKRLVISREVPPAMATALNGQIEAWDDSQAGKLILRLNATHSVEDHVRYLYSRGRDDERDPGTMSRVLETKDEAGCPTQSGYPRGQKVSQYFPDKAYRSSILLLLESPHVDEINEQLVPCAPAMGPTGGNIQRHLCHLAALLRTVDVAAGEFPVILANPIPYPTSCRLPLGKYGWWRDDVFGQFIKVNQIRDNFTQRLRDYAPIAIISACTSNVTGLVRDRIRRTLSGRIAPPIVYHRPNIDRGTGRKDYYVVQRNTALEDELEADWPEVQAGEKPIPLIELDHPSSWNATIKEWHIVPRSRP